MAHLIPSSKREGQCKRGHPRKAALRVILPHHWRCTLPGNSFKNVSIGFNAAPLVGRSARELIDSSIRRATDQVTQQFDAAISEFRRQFDAASKPVPLNGSGQAKRGHDPGSGLEPSHVRPPNPNNLSGGAGAPLHFEFGDS